jgi:hypothetical protein
VRQRSIALMTFIWSRLTCPALALRHAAPWSRKISATSSSGRDMTADRYAGALHPRRCVFVRLTSASAAAFSFLRKPSRMHDPMAEASASCDFLLTLFEGPSRRLASASAAAVSRFTKA